MTPEEWTGRIEDVVKTYYAPAVVDQLHDQVIRSVAEPIMALARQEVQAALAERGPEAVVIERLKSRGYRIVKLDTDPMNRPSVDLYIEDEL